MCNTFGEACVIVDDKFRISPAKNRVQKYVHNLSLTFIIENSFRNGSEAFEEYGEHTTKLTR